jgi:HAD superfamily hydrolase (TIGR01549 family)
MRNDSDVGPRPAPEACAVLFDIDGTLIDSTYHHALAWQAAFHGCDVEAPLYRIHRAVGMGGDKLVAHVAGDRFEEQLGDSLRSAWREQYVALKGDVVALSGATDLVHRTAGAGFRVALASSGDPEFAAEAVAMLEIDDDISAMTTADDVERSKPEPDLVGETLGRLDGVTHAVLVGDTPYDVMAAQRAGIGCVGLLAGGYSEGELTDAGASLVVGLPADLHDIDWIHYCIELQRL